jgi:hypothetical protein
MEMITMRLMTRCCFGAALALGLAACADGTGPAPVQVAGGLPILESYDTSFTLVQGQAREDTLHFQAEQPGRARMPFLVLSTPGDAGFSDQSGSLLPKGTRVRLTVQVERQQLVVHFVPEGYASSARPATVKLLLAGLDFQSRAGNSPRLRYRAVEDATWRDLPGQIRAVDAALVAEVQRRSNYAVAY